MTKTIRDRVLSLGASIAKGLNRLEQPKTTTVTLVLKDVESLATEASRDPARQISWVQETPQPTRADLVQVYESLDTLAVKLDDAIGLTLKAIEAHPTKPEDK